MKPKIEVHLTKMADNAHAYLQAILDKDRTKAISIITRLIEQGYGLVQIFRVLSEAQVEIGELWAKNIITVADEHFATQVTLDMIALASSRITKSSLRVGSAAVLSCVEGEFHYVGLKMFAEILVKEGWDVQFLGQSLPIRHIIDTLKKKKGGKVDLICLSVTIPFNISSLVDTIRALREEPVLKEAVIIVGGRVFKSKKISSMIEANSHERLADYTTTDIQDALHFLSKLHTKRKRLASRIKG